MRAASFAGISAWALMMLVGCPSLGVSVDLAAADPPPVMYLSLDGQSSALYLAVSTCMGLFNRNPSLYGSAFNEKATGGNVDREWWKDLAPKEGPYMPMETTEFLKLCLFGDGKSEAISKGYLRYNLTAQQLISPNIVTLAGVLDAVPLEETLNPSSHTHDHPNP